MRSVISKLKPSKKVAIGLGVAASLAGAAALGAVLTPGGNAVIHGCFDKEGRLRVIDPATTACKKDESPISWNQQGPQGDIGPIGLTGATGAAGPAGKDGSPGRDGRDGVQGPQGLTGPTGPQGPAGPAGAAGGGTGSTGGGTSSGGTEDLFLAVADVEGDSTDAQHPGEIVLLSFNWGVSQATTQVGGSGQGAGKAQFTSLTVTKHLDKSSPVLFLDSASGKHIQQVVLTERKGGSKPVEFLKVTLKDVLVTSVDTAGDSDLPLEKVSFSFAQIKIEFTPQKADGSSDAAVVGGWDLVANKQL